MFCTNIRRMPWFTALAPLRIAQRTQATLSAASKGDLKTSKSPDTGYESTLRTRSPRSFQALHLRPLKHEAEYGIPSCDLQLRSFSLQPLEFFSDFALRAAYYLGLPAFGPVPLPRITERWTVPRSHFIFKKSQENFERVTLRRMIQIKDGNPQTIQLWLAYLRRHQYHGVGMKANVWEFGRTGKAKTTEQLIASHYESTWPHLGQTKNISTADRVEELLNSRRFKEVAGSRQSYPVSRILK